MLRMADFQFFHDFIFMNGSTKMGSYLEQLFSQGLNFTNDQHP